MPTRPEAAARSRSRSPHHRSHRSHYHHERSRPGRSRSRSPDRSDRHGHKRRRSRSPPPRPVKLPYGAPILSKHDLSEYRPLFASYLDIQKQLYIEDLDEREVRGRWKSFIGKWNRGDLPEGWYDPTTLQKAKRPRSPPQRDPSYRRDTDEPREGTESPRHGDSGSDDEFAPALPRDIDRRAGPAIPSLEDLQYRNELHEEDRALELEDLRYARKKERRTDKERLEELAPRADPGSRERQLEKKRETTTKLQDFRDAKEAGDVEIGDADLMGDDGFEVYKKRKVEMERKKTEREIQKEERFRARAAEREARLAGQRVKEEKTMEFLKSLAKERFG